MSVEIRGEQELRRRIQALGRVVDGPALEDAVQAGAVVIEKEAAANASATIEAAMMTETSRTAHGAQADIGPSTEAWHALFVEIGTRNNAAKPFLRPALDTQRDATIREIGQELWESIRRAL